MVSGNQRLHTGSNQSRPSAESDVYKRIDKIEDEGIDFHVYKKGEEMFKEQKRLYIPGSVKG